MNTSVMRPLQVGCCVVAIAVLPSACSYKPTEVHQHDSQPAAVTYSPGYVVQTLPSGYTTTSVGGTTYYTANGTYFRPHQGGYVVVKSP